jgi:hypothetical protein
MKVTTIGQSPVRESIPINVAPKRALDPSPDLVVERKVVRLQEIQLKKAAIASELHFQQVREQVKKALPTGAYPQLDSIDRLDSLLGKQADLQTP